MRVSNLGIRAVGGYLPSRRKAIRSPEGHDLQLPVGVPESTTFSMAEDAVRSALTQAGLTPDSLEDQYLLACNETPGDRLFQMMGREIADRLGIHTIHSYNATQGGNCSLLLLRTLAAHLTAHPRADRGVVLAPGCWEYHTENRHLGHAVLGDATAALLLERDWPHNRLRSVVTRTDGRYHSVVYNEVGGWAMPYSREAAHSGRHLYKIHDVDAYEELRERTLTVLDGVIATALAEADADWQDLDHIAVHAATRRLHEDFLSTFPVGTAQVTTTDPTLGYLGSAGPLLALSQLLGSRPEPGTLTLLTTIGVDGNWAAAVLEA